MSLLRSSREIIFIVLLIMLSASVLSNFAPFTDNSMVFNYGASSQSNSTGISLSANLFSISPSFQLPQSCSEGQVSVWNASTLLWSCSNMSASVDLSNYYNQSETNNTIDARIGLNPNGFVNESGANVTSVNGKQGVVSLSAADVGALDQATADGIYQKQPITDCTLTTALYSINADGTTSCTDELLFYADWLVENSSIHTSIDLKQDNLTNSSNVTVNSLTANSIDAPRGAGIINYSSDYIMSNGDGTVNLSSIQVYCYDSGLTGMRSKRTIPAISYQALTDDWKSSANHIYVDCQTNAFVVTYASELGYDSSYGRYIRYATLIRDGTTVHIEPSYYLADKGATTSEQECKKNEYSITEDTVLTLTLNETFHISHGEIDTYACDHLDEQNATTSSERLYQIARNGTGGWQKISATNPKINNTHFDNGTGWQPYNTSFFARCLLYEGVEKSAHLYARCVDQYETQTAAESVVTNIDNPILNSEHAKYIGTLVFNISNAAQYSFTTTSDFVGQAASSNDYNSLINVPDHSIYALQSNLTSDNIKINYSGSVLTMNLNQAINDLWSAGVISGCNMSKNADGTINVSSGEVSIRPVSQHNAQIMIFTVPATNNLALSEGQNHIYYDFNNSHPFITSSTTITSFDCMSKCQIGVAGKQGNNITLLDATGQNVDVGARLRRWIIEVMGIFQFQQGTAVLSNIGTNVTLSSGRYWTVLIANSFSSFDTSVAGTSQQNIFTYYYRDGAGGWKMTANSKLIDSNNFDSNAGTLTAVGTGNYTSQCVYAILDNVNTSIGIIYDQDQHAILSDADAQSCPVTLPPLIQGSGKYVGTFIIQKGASVPSATKLWATSTGGIGGSGSYHNALLGKDGGDGTVFNHLGASVYSIVNENISSIQSLGFTNNNSKAIQFNCGSQFAQNVSNNSVQCATPSVTGSNYDANITALLLNDSNMDARQRADNSTIKSMFDKLVSNDSTIFGRQSADNTTLNISIASKLSITDQRFNYSSTGIAINNSRAGIQQCSAGQYVNGTVQTGVTCLTLPAGGVDQETNATARLANQTANLANATANTALGNNATMKSYVDSQNSTQANLINSKVNNFSVQATGGQALFNVTCSGSSCSSTSIALGGGGGNVTGMQLNLTGSLLQILWNNSDLTKGWSNIITLPASGGSVNQTDANLTSLIVTGTATVAGSAVCTQATGCGGSTPNFVDYKAYQRESRNQSTNTAWDVTDLNFALEANKNYTLDCNIFFSTNITTTGLVINISTSATYKNSNTSYTSWSGATAFTPVSNTLFNRALVGTGSGGTLIYANNEIGSVWETTSTGNLNITYRSEISASKVAFMRGSRCTLTKWTQ